MRKVAVFGNAGGGKSTLARRLADITGLPLHVTDIMPYPDGMYRAGDVDGGRVSPAVYDALHEEILRGDAWIIDGFESVAQAWKRFEAADTLVHVDLPVSQHYWGVTKRLVRGMFVNPAGWPERTPVWRSSLQSYRVIWRCHTRLTPRYRELVAGAAGKRVYWLRSYAEMSLFLRAVERECSAGISI